MSGTTGLVITLIALFAASLFATLHMALRTLVRTTLQDMAEDSGKPALQRRVERIVSDIDGHGVAIGLPRVISTLLGVVGLLFWVSQPGALASADPAALPSPPTTLHVVLTLLIASVVLWLFAFIVPSSIAEHARESDELRMACLVRAVNVLATPVLGENRLVDEI
ncbi:MAG: CNNM domain-containing protein, partial [Phycisphaerales bacterium JB041]